MTRKIAVLVRERQEEALRMALGLTLMDDTVEVFFLDKKFHLTDVDENNLELMGELGIEFFSNHQENKNMEQISTESLARRLSGYDHVIPY